MTNLSDSAWAEGLEYLQTAQTGPKTGYPEEPVSSCMKVWVFAGTTESGDDVGPYVFGHCPNTKELQEVLMRDWPSEFEMGKEEWIDVDFGYISTNRLRACEVMP